MITTEDCWDNIKNSDIKTETKKVLKGSISIDGCKTTDAKQSLIKLMNFESQFKPTILITRHTYDALELSSDVKKYNFSSFAEKCTENQEYNAWKSAEMWRIQKFKGGYEQ